MNSLDNGSSPNTVDRATAPIPTPTPQQICDYLYLLDRIERQVVEREARTLAPSASATLERAVCDLPPLPWPAMPRGSTDYFSAGQMRAFASAAIAQAMGLPNRDTEDGEVRAVPPRWYSREEIYQALVRMKYSDGIAQEISDWVVRHLQLAFNKGFEKGARARRPSARLDAGSFQARVRSWIFECFGAEIAGDRDERNHRFFEEAAELVQACGMTREEAHALVDYTWSRPVGETNQEVGGVMVTLAALCLANNLDMHEAAEIELARVWSRIEQIRAKQAAKSKHSPLPVELHSDDLAVDRFSAELKDKLRLSREKGRGGWEEADPTELSVMLREHVEKGDPRDVGNYCVFLWNLGKPISAAASSEGKRAVPASMDERVADIKAHLQSMAPDALHRLFESVISASYSGWQLPLQAGPDLSPERRST
uniref:hypothetical protein n=1 Tax=Burkholderia arboris TaxID=488730 RepID=UPI003BEF0140